jgi:hypothetical protein
MSGGGTSDYAPANINCLYVLFTVYCAAAATTVWRSFCSLLTTNARYVALQCSARCLHIEFSRATFYGESAIWLLLEAASRSTAGAPVSSPQPHALMHLARVTGVLQSCSNTPDCDSVGWFGVKPPLTRASICG